MVHKKEYFIVTQVGLYIHMKMKENTLDFMIGIFKTIVSKRGYTLDNLFGILAHEITHHFLHHFNICKSNEKENEIFTDISAIYLGFGHLLYSAYQIISYDSDWVEKKDGSSSYISHESKIGYITPQTIIKTIVLTCKMKNWDPKELLKRFESGVDRSEISIRLLDYRIKLFISNKLLFIGKIKSQRKESKIQKVVTDLERIQKKYEYIKKIMIDTSKFKDKPISEDDGEFLVTLTNDIFTSSIEEEIKINIKNVKDVKVTPIVFKKDIYRSTKKLEDKIDRWVVRLNDITR